MMNFEYKINDTFPHPKANNLHKIAAVVDVVETGANTGSAVAEALDIEEREGSYYADAAGYLGLVDTVGGEMVKTYAVTATGDNLRQSDTAERVAMLKDIIAMAPGVQVYAEDGFKGVMEMLDYAGLAEATAQRRAACIQSWFNQATEDAVLTAAVGASVVDAQGRALAAAKNAEEARKARILAAAPVERVTEVCMDCFMQKAESGACGC
jgi:hypothetical protein